MVKKLEKDELRFQTRPDDLIVDKLNEVIELVNQMKESLTPKTVKVEKKDEQTKKN